MSTCYESKYVKCPFYKYHDKNSTCICCEGVDDSNTIHLTFGAKASALMHTKRYCNDNNNYRKCLIAQMLERKWNDE